MINWITLDDLSAYLKVSKASLYKLVQAGEIPAVKLGRNWRFDRDEVDRWLQASRPAEPPYPWQDCLDVFSGLLRQRFGERFVGLWLFGSWARGEAQPASDVDLLVVLDQVPTFEEDFATVLSLGYQATFERDRTVLFAVTLVDRETAEIEKLVAKSHRALAAAKQLLKSDDYDFAVSRAYYAMFYVTEAVLLTKNLAPSKHSALVSLFYEHFIRPGIFDKSLHKDLHDAFELRQQGDYWADAGITEAMAQEVLGKAKNFISVLAEFIK